MCIVTLSAVIPRMPIAVSRAPGDVALTCVWDGAQISQVEPSAATTTVAFIGYGMAASFAGEAGLPKFRRDLDTFLKETRVKSYNSRSAVRVVLFKFVQDGRPALGEVRGEPAVREVVCDEVHAVQIANAALGQRREVAVPRLELAPGEGTHPRWSLDVVVGHGKRRSCVLRE